MTTALARRFKLDVSTDNTNWVTVKGLDDLNPSITPNKVSADDYDSDGWTGYEITMQSWSIVAKALRKTDGSGAFDPAQELIRGARAQFGDAARVYVRWYDRNGANEAYSGRAIVEWNQSKSGVADLDEVTITLTGDGILTPISNPSGSAAVPVIVTATPSGAAAGAQVEITGQGFASTVASTGVKIGGTAATPFTVVSDSVIVATVPTGTAGATTITVTNSAGTSANFNYTRG